ncbi:hypothetical protein KEM52_000157 [Ascosphaera acerosa]|nr:hypothetical protein KEM52_000157 [Ascosphaera acerosa]
MRSLRLIAATLLLATTAAALPDIAFGIPAGGEVFHGGETLHARWTVSGNDSYIPAGTTYMEGAELAGTSQTAAAGIPHSIGGNHANAYFLQMIIDPAGEVAIINSPRFGVASLTGTLPARVRDALVHLHPTVTQPPATPAAAVAAVTGTHLQDLAKRQAGEPYASQTGTVRYAPPQQQPGTKMAKKNLKPLYPTSWYEVATRPLDPPAVKTTISVSLPWRMSVENTAAAAGEPTDAVREADQQRQAGQGLQGDAGDEGDEFLRYVRRWAD